ncbi:hypothetical protein QTN25_004019 [Entamoeba marina]
MKNLSHKQLDSYSMMIVSKYFTKPKDYINMTCVCSKFFDTLDKFRYNPISVKSLRLFPFIQTQHLYTKRDVRIPNLYQYIAWYSVSYNHYLCKKDQIHFKHITSTTVQNCPNANHLLSCKIQHKHHLPLPPITIPSQFTSINSDSSITLSSHLERVDNNCFTSCHKLSTITINPTTSHLQCDLPKYIHDIISKQSVTCPYYHSSEDTFRHGTEISPLSLTPSLILPTTTTSLGDFCFYQSIFTSIEGLNVLKLGEGCFEQCGQLQCAKFPKVQTLGAHCFSYCRCLQSLIIPTKLHSVGGNCFQKIHYRVLDCLKQTNQIPNFLLYKDTFEMKLTIPTIFTVIGKSTFSNSELREITLPNTIHAIHQNLVLSSSLTCIPSNCFGNCKMLHSIIIPHGVTQLAKSAFYNCSFLEIVYIPTTLTTISRNCFKNCSYLHTLSLTPLQPNCDIKYLINCNFCLPPGLKISFPR